MKNLRERRHLTPDEVSQLIEQADRGRYPARDRLMIEMMFRHGLRVSELVNLRWSDIDWTRGRILVRRMKAGRDTTHPLNQSEKYALKSLKPPHERQGAIFTSERGQQMSRGNVNRIVAEIANETDIPIRVTPHRLRHACGFALASKGVDAFKIQQFMGHKSIMSTALYVDLAGRELTDIWE